MTETEPIIIGTWKMQLGVPESIELAKKIKKGISKKGPEVVVCPSFVSLTRVADVLKKGSISLGAQDCFWEEHGAYTGEVSAHYLKEVGCKYVILGHSERRKHLQETDEMINKKIKTALRVGLTPIVCIGETLEQRQDGDTNSVLIVQASAAFKGVELNVDQQIIIAYEPVWAISPSPHDMQPEQTIETNQVIKQHLLDIFPQSIVKNNIRLIYGGSVDSTDAASFIALENTSGVLVGGASLKSEEFLAIIKSVS
ncbi:MAG: triose-phosphate isomerase [Parcubacteria group bacterium]|nr:triose-phosphate isomerase [Parcubacteria group bacterium]|tara:strand:- start:944 stop:1708 length:765 start_codon:yes stop_codon:yes gene_type:complete